MALLKKQGWIHKWHFLMNLAVLADHQKLKSALCRHKMPGMRDDRDGWRERERITALCTTSVTRWWRVTWSCTIFDHIFPILLLRNENSFGKWAYFTKLLLTFNLGSLIFYQVMQSEYHTSRNLLRFRARCVFKPPPNEKKMNILITKS